MQLVEVRVRFPSEIPELGQIMLCLWSRLGKKPTFPCLFLSIRSIHKYDWLRKDQQQSALFLMPANAAITDMIRTTTGDLSPFSWFCASIASWRCALSMCTTLTSKRGFMESLLHATATLPYTSKASSSVPSEKQVFERNLRILWDFPFFLVLLLLCCT